MLTIDVTDGAGSAMVGTGWIELHRLDMSEER